MAICPIYVAFIFFPFGAPWSAETRQKNAIKNSKEKNDREEVFSPLNLGKKRQENSFYVFFVKSVWHGFPPNFSNAPKAFKKI
jgi:hypothetical protein